jgi:sugar lactone lactonase YvrE
VAVALLPACAGSGTAPGPTAVTPSLSTGLNARAASGKPTVYAASLNAAGKPFIAVFGAGGETFSRKIKHGFAVAADSRGNAYIAHTPVTVYADAGKTLVQKFPVTNGPRELDYGNDIVPDGLGDFYVTCGHHMLCEYQIGKNGPIRELPAGFGSLATDKSGDLYQSVNGGEVVEYSPGSTSPKRTITSGIAYPEALAVDHKGNLYVGNLEGGTDFTADVTVYGPNDNSPRQTISEGVTNPLMIRVDSDGNVGVLNFTNVTMYAPGSDTPSNVITQGIANADSLAFDQSNNLYVANFGATNNDPGSITVYAAGSYSLTRTITKNIKHSISVAVGP